MQLYVVGSEVVLPHSDGGSWTFQSRNGIFNETQSEHEGIYGRKVLDAFGGPFLADQEQPYLIKYALKSQSLT